eukprot:TRINITY_DN1815_c0_g1_i4.p1 TRINITY_DN1815_c0_g1~~TRINITY_DN1815_c0_g1_i4.p1  ORF type:complete len:314 (+),score=107.28 TRINITY_DN1815_c0_g1_i4:893-1834(+)
MPPPPPPPPAQLPGEFFEKVNKEMAESGVPSLQVQIKDGEIILDSTTLEYTPVQPEADTNNACLMYPAIEEGIHTKSTGYARKTQQVSTWTKEETTAFYNALRMVGTDFTLLSKMMKKRTRAQIKSKFKKEEKEHPLLIDFALKNRIALDIDILRAATGLKLELKPEPPPTPAQEQPTPASEPPLELPPTAAAEIEAEPGIATAAASEDTVIEEEPATAVAATTVKSEQEDSADIHATAAAPVAPEADAVLEEGPINAASLLEDTQQPIVVEEGPLPAMGFDARAASGGSAKGTGGESADDILARMMAESGNE